MKALPEIRDWLAFAFGFVSVVMAWRYRDIAALQGRHHVVELHDTVTLSDRVPPAGLNLGPSRGTSSTSLALTTPPLITTR